MRAPCAAVWAVGPTGLEYDAADVLQRRCETYEYDTSKSCFELAPRGDRIPMSGPEGVQHSRAGLVRNRLADSTVRYRRYSTESRLCRPLTPSGSVPKWVHLNGPGRVLVASGLLGELVRVAPVAARRQSDAALTIGYGSDQLHSKAFRESSSCGMQSPRERCFGKATTEYGIPPTGKGESYGE